MLGPPAQSGGLARVLQEPPWARNHIRRRGEPLLGWEPQQEDVGLQGIPGDVGWGWAMALGDSLVGPGRGQSSQWPGVLVQRSSLGRPFQPSAPASPSTSVRGYATCLFSLPLFCSELSFLLAEPPSLISAGSEPSPSEKPWCWKAAKQHLLWYLLPGVREALETTNVDRGAQQKKIWETSNMHTGSSSRYSLPPGPLETVEPGAADTRMEEPPSVS